MKAITLAAAAAALITAGCSGNGSENSGQAGSASAQITGAGSTFVYPVLSAWAADYQKQAGTAVNYTVTVKALKRRVLPELDDEFARDLGEFDTLAALRSRVEQDLTREAEQKAEREVRGDLLKQVAGWVTFSLPESLIDREIDRGLVGDRR